MSSNFRAEPITQIITENYCHLLNVTKSILSITAKVNNNIYISCANQTKESICNNINILFLNSFVIPNSNYVKVIDMLQKSLINTLQCNSNNTSTSVIIKTQKFNFDIVYIIIGVILLKVACSYCLKKKYN